MVSCTVSICISLMTHETGHPSVGFLAICIMSLAKYLVKSFAHFSVELSLFMVDFGMLFICSGYESFIRCMFANLFSLFGLAFSFS